MLLFFGGPQLSLLASKLAEKDDTGCVTKRRQKHQVMKRNQPRKRQDVRSAQEDLQEKMWDVGERGFLPAMDPVKDLPSPWDELVIIMDYVPSFSVQGHGAMGAWFFFKAKHTFFRAQKTCVFAQLFFSLREKTTRYF